MEDVAKKAMERIEELNRWRQPIRDTILQIAEEKKIEPVTLYSIMVELIEDLEAEQPELKMTKMIRDSLIKDGENAPEEIFKQIHGDSVKPDFCVCSPEPAENSKKTRCDVCNRIVYHSKSAGKLEKNAKKICPKCMMETLKDKDPSEIDPFTKIILEKLQGRMESDETD